MEVSIAPSTIATSAGSNTSATISPITALTLGVNSEGLRDGRVAGRHRRDQRPHRAWTPGSSRADDQAAPARLVDDARLGAQRDERGRDALRAHPALQVLLRMADVVDHRQQLGEIDLHRRFAQILGEGRGERLAAAPSAHRAGVPAGRCARRRCSCAGERTRGLAGEQRVDDGRRGFAVARAAHGVDPGDGNRPPSLPQRRRAGDGSGRMESLYFQDPVTRGEGVSPPAIRAAPGAANEERVDDGRRGFSGRGVAHSRRLQHRLTAAAREMDGLRQVSVRWRRRLLRWRRFGT